MRRVWILLAALLGLGALAVATVRLDSDAGALVGDGSDLAAALDGPAGRLQLVAILSPDGETREAAGAAVSAFLAQSPLVAPPPDETAIADALWRLRFALSPPGPEDLTEAAMTEELAAARRALTSMGDTLLADRYLRDPAGSFRRLVAALGAWRDAATPQARGDALVIPVLLADRPFDAEAQRAFDAELRQRIEAAGAEAILIGPRSISARVGAIYQERSLLIGALGGAGLLLWLAVVLRSAGAVVAVLLPPAAGLAAGTLAVQALFGEVHVVALGFGGTLLGLAIDYPLHLFAHRGRAVRRRVLLGAATSVGAFATLSLAGIPAIVQVGIFVGAGLVAAAGAAIWLNGAAQHEPRMLPTRLRRPVWRSILPAAGTVTLAAAAVIILTPGETERPLFEPPEEVIADLARMAEAVDLPSGRHRVALEAPTLAELLVRHRQLAAAIGPAVEAGILDAARSPLDALPETAPAPLPSTDEIAIRVERAVREAGLRPDFAETILAEYRAAAEALLVTTADPALLELAGVTQVPEGFTARVALYGVEDPAALAEAVSELPGVSLADDRARLSSALANIRAHVLACLGIGALLCAGVLTAALGFRRTVPAILLSCAAATALTAVAATLTGGGLDIFELVALTLVIGIGLDYAIFLRLAETRAEDTEALRSVALCAVTTLIPFVIMAILGTGLLRDVGMTVSVGVIFALLVALPRSRPASEG